MLADIKVTYLDCALDVVISFAQLAPDDFMNGINGDLFPIIVDKCFGGKVSLRTKYVFFSFKVYVF